MFDNTLEGWYYTFFGLFLIITFISWLGFARFSMARIERQMQKDGLVRPASWDGVGLRALWYASAIAFPVGIFNRAEDPLIDVPTVRRYSTSFDRVLGWILMVSGFLLVAMTLSGVFLDID